MEAGRHLEQGTPDHFGFGCQRLIDAARSGANRLRAKAPDAFFEGKNTVIGAL